MNYNNKTVFEKACTNEIYWRCRARSNKINIFLQRKTYSSQKAVINVLQPYHFCEYFDVRGSIILPRNTLLWPRPLHLRNKSSRFQRTIMNHKTYSESLLTSITLAAKLFEIISQFSRDKTEKWWGGGIQTPISFNFNFRRS